MHPITGKPLAAHQSSEGMMIIGRSSRGEVVILAHYSTISGNHATMSPIDDSLEVIDADGHRPSTNCLFINGFRSPGIPAVLLTRQT